MKVFIKIHNHEVTMANFLFPPLASCGWKKIAQKLCDRIIDDQKTCEGYEVKGEVKNKEVLQRRLLALTKEEQERLYCVAYPHPHRHDSTLYYDWWFYNHPHLDLLENQTCYKDDSFCAIPYQARLWLNDGQSPDQDSYRFSSFSYLETSEGSECGSDVQPTIDDEEHTAAMYHLFHR